MAADAERRFLKGLMHRIPTVLRRCTSSVRLQHTLASPCEYLSTTSENRGTKAPNAFSLSSSLSRSLSPCKTCTMHCSNQKIIYHCFKYAWKTSKILNNLIFWNRKQHLTARESNKDKFKVIFINTEINCPINRTLAHSFFLTSQVARTFKNDTSKIVDGVQ